MGRRRCAPTNDFRPKPRETEGCRRPEIAPPQTLGTREFASGVAPGARSGRAGAQTRVVASIRLLRSADMAALGVSARRLKRELIAGSLVCESVPGHGSTFRVTLPVAWHPVEATGDRA